MPNSTSRGGERSPVTFACTFCPPYSPELSPKSRRVWKLTRRRCLHNRYFATLEEVIPARWHLHFKLWSRPNATLRRALWDSLKCVHLFMTLCLVWQCAAIAEKNSDVKSNWIKKDLTFNFHIGYGFYATQGAMPERNQAKFPMGGNLGSGAIMFPGHMGEIMMEE